MEIIEQTNVVHIWVIYEQRKKKVSIEKEQGKSKEEKRLPEGKPCKKISLRKVTPTDVCFSVMNSFLCA